MSNPLNRLVCAVFGHAYPEVPWSLGPRETVRCRTCGRIDGPTGNEWRLERDYDAKNGTHRLTNGRAQLSVWTAEVSDPDLNALEAQLRRGATPPPTDSPNEQGGTP